MIERLNRQFVCTTLPYLALKEFGDSGNPLAREILRQWKVPLVLVFLSPEGRFVTKISSLEEVNQIHPDTTKRPEAPQYHASGSERNNARVFLDHLNRYFPLQGGP